MKLVTWNVNSLNPRMPRVLELLETHRPVWVTCPTGARSARDLGEALLCELAG